MTRQERALKLIDTHSQSGLEIGPLVSPLVTADMGKIAYADHATTEELRNKYANDTNVDESKIVDITYVWGDQTLREAVGEGTYFDYVITSHVIEHVPDVITWLKEIYEILKPGGILSLLIPDKRFTFDVARSCTIPADMIDAHLRRLRKPSPRQIYDHFTNVVRADHAVIWARGNTGENFEQMFSSPSIGLNMARKAVENDSYLDSHCWVFTPYSFFQVMRELAETDLFNYEIADFIDTQVNEIEFCVSLRKPLDPKDHTQSEILASFPDLPEPDIRNGVEYFRPEEPVQSEASLPLEPDSNDRPVPPRLSLFTRIVSVLRGR